MKSRLLLLMTSLFSIVILLLIEPSIGYAKQLSQTGNGPFLCLVTPPVTASFPNVTLNFRMLDAKLNPVTVAQQDIVFSENGQVPVPVAAQGQAIDSGLKYYIITDKGNRTPQNDVQNILLKMNSYVVEPTDVVNVYTNENNRTTSYYPGTAKANSFAQAASNYPIIRDSEYRQVGDSLEEVLREIEKDTDPCSKNRVIIMIIGDDTLETLEKNEALAIGQRIKASATKLVIFHLSSTHTFNSRDIYSELANQASGTYQQVISLDDDIKPVLDNISLYKRTFSYTYRTNYGQTGSHDISAVYQGTAIPFVSGASYPIDIQPPSVTLEGSTTIQRLVEENKEKNATVYSSDSAPYIVRIKWTDSHPRDISPNARLIVKDGNSEKEVDVILKNKGDDSYEVTWNYSDIKTIATTPYIRILSVKITDEFGNQVVSSPIEISLTVEKGQSPITEFMMYALYGLASLVVLLIILMIVGWIFFRNQMRSIAARGGAAVGKIAGEIRKTLVGGGERGKPIASLKVLEGPPTMLGQELKVYTESIKLGRNPQLADMTFFAPDILTSVSGLHARLEKVNGSWRVVALSESRSETFIDEQSLPFHEPVVIANGQKIRLGYPAQQPVVLLFSSEQAEPRKTLVGNMDNDPRKTDVSMPDKEDKTKPGGLFGRPNSKAENKKQVDKPSDSIFDEFQ